MTAEKKQRFYLLIIMVMVSIGVGSVVLFKTYQEHLRDHKMQLLNIVKTQAHIIESVAEFDDKYSSNFPGGSREATLSQIRKAHDKIEGFGNTGEFLLAQREGNFIIFLLRSSQKKFKAKAPDAVPLSSNLSEPMKLALQGKSGIIIGLDYRGEKVLAAYEPVNALDLGLVAKMDISEIQKPFIQATVTAGFGGAIIILVGTFAFFRMSKPLIRTIQESQERYEMAVKGTKDGLWDWMDVNREEEWWSPQWYNLLGYRDREIEANFSNFKNFLHPDDLPSLENALKAHFEQRRIFDLEFRMKHKSGSYKWFRGRGEAVFDSEGNPERMSGSIQDIDALKKNVDRIRKLSRVVEESPIAVLITDADGKIEYVNSSLLKISGYSLHEVIGQNPRMFKSGESPQEYYENLWGTLSAGSEWRGVFLNKRKNGDLYWESVLIAPLKDEDGKVTNYIGLKEDITEKKRLESTLIDHERLIRSVIEHLKDGLVIVNKKGFIQMFNFGAESVFGYKSNEVMNKNISILIPEALREKHLAGFEKLKKSGKSDILSSSLEVEGRKKNGGLFPLELRVTEMVQRGEKFFIGIIRDISEKKENEEKLKNAQKKMLVSQKLASIGELAAGVSHEVMNPVNIISIHAQLLQRKMEHDENVQNFSNKVDNEIKRIQKIMNGLLEFSRMGDVSLVKKDGILRKDIEEVIGLVEDKFKLDNVLFVRDWCCDDALLSYDSDKMRQVFLNLVNNAKYAMPEGGAITVGCRPMEKSGKKFHQYFFKDTGTGMEEEVALKIFDPFFTTKPEGKGTGMGLAIVHGIIEEHGGEIFVESQIGKGTEFFINLPGWQGGARQNNCN